MNFTSMETPTLELKAEKIGATDSNRNRMPHKTLSTCLAVAISCLLLPPVRQAVAQAAAPAKAPVQAQPWKSIPIPPLHNFKPTQPHRIELANGLVIFLQEDHELPFIDGSILIRGGSRETQADKEGLVPMYGEAWRTSGTATKSGDVLDTELAEKAAAIESNGGNASTSLSWSCFKQDFDSVFGETVDLLLHPAFKTDKLALAKREMDTGISRRNDDAEGIAGRESTRLVYGKDSPYAREAEYATVASVTLDDLQAWHDRTVIPNGIIVSVGGDFDSAEMETKLRKVFESLPRGTLVETPKVDFPGPKPGIYFADKEDVNQSTVEIVGLGTVRSNPDYYALSVMNEIFSGGFGSRVFQKVRTKLGLAYSVGGSFGSLYDHPGIFRSSAGTKSVSTVSATQAILEEINRLKTDPPTPDEMRQAKDQVLNSFIFNFDTPEKTLNEQRLLAFYGYPPDFLDRYKDAVEHVTAADVTRVANKYIDVSKLAILVVGNKSDIQPPLSALGAVTDLDITIPPPAGKPAAGAPASGPTQ
jgi:zinc protease